MTRILVVDDSLSVRKALEKILNSLAEVSVAESAEDALAQLFSDVPLPDLIISDVLMPGMSGPELAKSLRLLQQTARVPVILISGIIDDEVHRQAQEVGAQAVVRKPFSAEELLPIVRHALNPDGAPSPHQTQGKEEPVPPQEATYEPELDTGRAHVKAAHPDAQNSVPDAAATFLAESSAPMMTPQSGMVSAGAASVEALLNPALAATSPPVASPGVVQGAATGNPDVLVATDHAPPVQPESSWGPPEQPAVDQTNAVTDGHTGSSGLVEALMQKPGVLGVLVSDAAGVTHSRAGDLTPCADDLSMYARFFNGTSEALGQRLGRGEGMGTQLDYRNGALLLLPLGPGHLLVCLLADANSGSMVRFTVRRHLAATGSGASSI